MSRDTVEQIIGRFGSQQRVAELLGIWQTAVSGWVRRGAIPSRRQEQLLTIAQREGITLAPAIGRFAEAESALARTEELGTPTVEVLLARARLYRERAWFSVAGESQRYSSGTFPSQLISMAVMGPAPTRIEEGRKYLRLAERAPHPPRCVLRPNHPLEENPVGLTNPRRDEWGEWTMS